MNWPYFLIGFLLGLTIGLEIARRTFKEATQYLSEAIVTDKLLVKLKDEAKK